MRPSSHRFTAAAWFVAAGAALAAYPILRPYPGGGAPDGSTQLASGAWPLAHVLGMFGFVAVAFGLRALDSIRPAAWSGSAARRAETFAWASVALLLPYYGAEAFGLHALGQYAAQHGDVAVLAVVDSFRYAALPMTLFGIGLVLLAVTGVLVARGARSGGGLSRVGGLVVAVGAVTYLPQFFGPAPVRMLHGLVLGAGLALLGVAVARTRDLADPSSGGGTHQEHETAPSAT
ncbi:hypothetical protein ACWEOW_22140 [Monashia sp. NPDC004114]